MKNTKRGFTLIELLVVIAIIGILSSVVLASLNSARAKGADASVKSNLANLRSQAELYYDDNDNTYSDAVFAPAACPAAASPADNMFESDRAADAIEGANTAGGGGATGTRCYSDGQNYVVSVRLKSNTALAWCVDSSGAAHEITFDTWAAASRCPAAP